MTVLLILLFAAIAFTAIFVPPIAQDPAYHSFHDQRALFGIPHFANAVSNVPFLLAGTYGLFRWRAARLGGCFVHPIDRWPWLFAALGAIGIGFGSGWYHLAPSNATLLWDRLPMTVVFMSLFAAILTEREIAPPAPWLIPLLLTVGAASVFYWHVTEAAGRGDLRAYALVQFYPMVAIPIALLTRAPRRYRDTAAWWTLIFLYAAAKVAEFLDAPIAAATAEILSGHSLKHILGAVALTAIFRTLPTRRIN